MSVGEAIEAVDVPSSDTLADAGAAPEATNTVTFDEIGGVYVVYMR